VQKIVYNTKKTFKNISAKVIVVYLSTFAHRNICSVSQKKILILIFEMTQ